MAWLRDRLTRKRIAAIAIIVAVAAMLTLAGDPLGHPETGSDDDGRVGVGGIGRTAEIAAILVALILALPPRDRGDERDDDG